ncbi:hypothetical protein KSS87_015118 [Heliosperma pusillum]|nr:hypothetical protein KSS87_015118 [Heliosperma pusillum]
MAEIPKITQIFIKLFDNKTLTLQFPPQIPINFQSLTHQIQSLTQIPQNLQTLTLNGKLLSQITSPTLKIPNFSTLTLTLPLLGGKGGFGSLLRGAATKAGQKKTNNFDACRDMSGRRLRHVNAEKKMEEWAADEAERKLEKKAEKYLKEMTKKGKGGKRDDGAEKYVEMYRLESARCVEEVERSVREAAAGMAVSGRKRKGVEKKGGDGVDAKKLKIWKGKRKIGESDSDDSDGDSESDDSDAEKEISAVTDNGNQSDSSKDVSNGSILVLQSGQDQNGGGSSDSVSEEEKSVLIADSVETGVTPLECKTPTNIVDRLESLSDGEEKTCEKPYITAEVALVEVEGMRSEPVDCDVLANSECKTISPEETVVGSSIVSEVPQPLNFDNFGWASELEVLGLERLKSELQERGLKCGGTLQERAARLFLLKTTPLEKLPKKLLAKK